MVLTHTVGRDGPSALRDRVAPGQAVDARDSGSFKIVDHTDRYTLVQGDGVMLMRQYQAPPPMVYKHIQTLLDLPSPDTEFNPDVAAAAGVSFAVIRRGSAPRVITALAQEGVYPLDAFIEKNLPVWEESKAALQQAPAAPRRAAARPRG